jgi:hypothetical protein
MKVRLAAVLAALLTVVPSAVSACAVCFGGAESNLVKGFTWGILILLILPFALTAGFITMVVRATRRKKTI